MKHAHLFRSLSRSAWRVALASAAMLFFSVDDVAAQCAEEAQWQRVELNLGSGVAAPIVENAGQLAEDAAYGAIAANGTAARFLHSGGVGIVMDDDLRVGFDLVETDGEPTYQLGESLPGGVTYLGAGAPGQLEAWGALEAHGLYGAAVAEHRVTGRTWRVRWSGEAGDLGRVALRPSGIAEITADADSGDLRLRLEADPEREMVLHPARVVLGEEESWLPFADAGDGTLRLSGEVPEGAELETLLVTAPYYHGGDAVADGRGGYVAAGFTTDAVETLGKGGSGADVVVLRTGGDGRAFQGMTILASSGEDRHAGIASRGGDAYVTGTAGAADFPLTSGKKQVFPAPFTVRLSSDGSLAAGGYLRAHGLESAHDIAVDGEGRVLVAGEATAEASSLGEIELTTVLPSDTGAPSTLFTLAELDPGLNVAERTQTFEGEATGLPLEVRIACDGGLTVGLATSSELSCTGLFPTWRPVTYPDPPTVGTGTGWLDAYSLLQQPSFPYASWGYHALQWKYQSQILSGLIYDNAEAAATTVPTTVPVGHVAWNDAARLNALENDPDIFPNGDPPGGWQRNLTRSSSQGLEAAIGAAAYAAWWGSPTYMNLRLDGPWTDGVAVMEVTFCSKRDPNGADGRGAVELCRDERPGPRPAVDVFDEDCVDNVPLVNDTSQIFLDQVVLHQWYAPLNMVNEDFRDGLDFRLRFEQAVPGRVYVGDPPTASRFGAGQVEEAAARELAFAVEEVPVTVTTYAGGGVVSAASGSGLARSVDLAAAQQ